MNMDKFIFRCLLVLCVLFFMPSVNAVGTVTYFHNDVAGTPMLATDAAGNVLWKENYLPYGWKLNNQAGSEKNKLGFADKPFDENSGLSYNGARYYDPVLGRFNGIDPQGFDEANIHSSNRYTYANNNPYKFVDPDGQFAIIPWALWAIGTAWFVHDAINPTPVPGYPDAIKSSAGPLDLLPPIGAAAVSRFTSAKKPVITREVIIRKTLGGDGAKSAQIIERQSEKMISRTHVVTKDKNVLHQHQNHTGKYGGERQFPDEWTGTKQIDAPYENIPPSSRADRVPGGRTF